MVSKETLEEIKYYSEHPWNEKTAKEMFEELGFNCRKELYENDQLIEIQFNTNKGTWVVILKERIEYVENHSQSKLPLNLLQAINKQVEELGWNK